MTTRPAAAVPPCKFKMPQALQRGWAARMQILPDDETRKPPTRGRAAVASGRSSATSEELTGVEFAPQSGARDVKRGLPSEINRR